MFWVLTRCCLVRSYQRFGGTYRLHIIIIIIIIKDDDARLPGCTVSSEKTAGRFVGSTARHVDTYLRKRCVFYLLVNKGMLQIELKNCWALGFCRSSRRLLLPLR
jgi:hypothetical protein